MRISDWSSDVCSSDLFGIGTSEVEHVLATQTLAQKPAKNMLVRVNGQLGPGVTAKDIALAIIGHLGTAGATGYVIEYAGDAITSRSEERRVGKECVRTCRSRWSPSH